MRVKFSMRAARIHAGLSIEEAAKLLELEVDTLRNYEKCVEFPTIEEGLRMIKIYKLETIDDIVFMNKPLRLKYLKSKYNSQKKLKNKKEAIKSLTNFNN